ncbi:mll5435 [Mesorhizobium japonicum MAFF 303099]|uniref:Mll5435 protein n=3 Tax=Mesorhizobium TaxID=68287 RepID=Q98BT4_RHILO|nr:mll5435 [Mesorhizobium japonicum MAFF 303099]
MNAYACRKAGFGHATAKTQVPPMERTDMKTILRNATLAAAVLGGAGMASADSIPGMRGHDHTGITVPDMKQAVDFFTEVVGCKNAMSFGPFADDKGTFMQDLLGVDPKAVIEQVTMVRCGYGSNIELFKYTAPDQKDLTPKNSDIGGFHIALYVDDVAAAKAYLDGKGVKTRMGPLPVKEGPAAGQTILYFQAPWGLQLEAISYPDGMAYEKGAETVLWSPKNPEK